MKKLIFIALLFIGYNSIAQITIDAKYEWQRDSIFWKTVKTYQVVAGSSEVNDSIVYTFKKLPIPFNPDRISVEYVSTSETEYYQKTKRLRAVVMRSRNVKIQRLIYRYTYVQLPNSSDEMIYKYLIKAKELNINNNNTFWNYPPIDSIVNPINTVIQ